MQAFLMELAMGYKLACRLKSTRDLGATLLLLVLAAGESRATESLAPDHQSMLSAWDAFCEDLKLAGREIVKLSGDHPVNVAEGFQYLAMLTGIAIERMQYYEIPSHPIVSRSLDGYKKLGLDSSDVVYRMVRFEPGGHYRIRGTRGDSSNLDFQINAGRSALININAQQIKRDDNQAFELYLGGEPRDENWVALPKTADNMYIREVFLDWDKETPTRLWIERLDETRAPPPATIGSVTERLSSSGEFVKQNIPYWENYVRRARDNNLNRFARPRGATAEGGSADNLYSGGYFDVSPEEALIIETEGADASYFSIQLGNRWFQSLDYQFRQTSLNNKQAVQDVDGRYRFVVAHTDPGIANWLDTAGHTDGVMYFRWTQAKRSPGTPTVTKVLLEEVVQQLPATTAKVSAGERQQTIRMRYEAVARRFGL